MLKFESLIESLVEQKMHKSKSTNNDKDLQKEEFIQQIIIFIERIIENTIQNYMLPIQEQLRNTETQILQIQSQLLQNRHPFSPKNKEIIKIDSLSSNRDILSPPHRLNEQQVQDKYQQKISSIEEKLQNSFINSENILRQFQEFKSENKSQSFYSYWVLLNDLNENVNKIREVLSNMNIDNLPQKMGLSRLSTKN